MPGAAAANGATMVEYGLLVALIAVIVAIAAQVLGAAISTLFDTTEGSLVTQRFQKPRGPGPAAVALSPSGETCFGGPNHQFWRL